MPGMSRAYRARRQLGSLIGLSMCLTVAAGQERGVIAEGAGECPTRFDYEVLASAADSGNFLSLSAYRFRHATSYSSLPLPPLERVAFRPDAPTLEACRFHRQRTLQQRG
jgi:hypothetical protein